MARTWFYEQCLKSEFSERLSKNPRYSLRAYARDLEVDPSILSRILSGKKIPTPNLTQKFLSHLSLSPQDQQTFKHSMAEAYETSGVKRKKPEIHEILRKRSHLPATRDLTPEIFKIISDWHHYAILQLIETESFQSNPRAIASQLGISESSVKLALSRLEELEMITTKNGRIIRTAHQLTTGDLLTTTTALRKRIRQITEKSLTSLENDPIQTRNHTTMTMAIDPAKIPLAKQLIQEFMDTLSETLMVKKKQVYELQINLFPLQRSFK